jgi:hypoxanthine phosphoribosyltransferase
METQLKLNVAGLDFVPYIPYSQISRRVEELGTELNQDYEGLSPIFLPILNGSFMFAADLIKEICIPCQVSFVKIASYEGTQSSGKVSQLIGLQQDLEGRHIILVEDIVDTGITVKKILDLGWKLKYVKESEEYDWKYHVDFMIQMPSGKEAWFDVKCMRSLRRGWSPQSKYMWVELTQNGWLFGGKSSHIAQQITEDTFALFDKKELEKYVKEKVKTYLPVVHFPEECFERVYIREHNSKQNVLSLIDTQDAFRVAGCGLI